jgi:HAD superfamily hydrolase (TIGR01490 family)
MTGRMVLVDIDGTLFGGMSSEAAFILHLLRRGSLGPRQLLGAAAFYLRWTPRYGRHVAKKNKAYLTGLNLDDVAAWAEQFVTNELLPRVRPVMGQRLTAHRNAGDFIALLSGTPAFIAKPLARALHADAWSATRCVVHDGVFTAAPPTAHPFGREKLQRAAELCGAHGLSLTMAAAYADSAYDVPLLRCVRQPVVVAPDATLERIAREQGWEIIGPDQAATLDHPVGI